jgi:hypothetical protein
MWEYLGILLFFIVTLFILITFGFTASGYIFINTDFKKPGFMITFYILLVFLLIASMSVINICLLKVSKKYEDHINPLITENLNKLNKLIEHEYVITSIPKDINEIIILGLRFSFGVAIILSILLILIYTEAAFINSNNKFIMLYCFIVLFYVVYAYMYTEIHHFLIPLCTIIIFKR